MYIIYRSLNYQNKRSIVIYVYLKIFIYEDLHYKISKRNTGYSKN